MGNRHGHHNHNLNHHGSSKSGESTPTSDQFHQISENDQDETPTLMPIDILAKSLTELTVKEEGISGGVSSTIFQRYLFPRYPILGEKLFVYFHQLSESKMAAILTSAAFRQQSERYLSILDDDVVRETLVRMFTNQSDTMSPDTLRTLLMCAYQISMDHYAEGPQTCLSITRTLKTIVDGCFYQKTQLSAKYVVHWLTDNCPRLLAPLHRYIVHALATTHRLLVVNDVNLDQSQRAAGLELATPVLEQAAPSFAGARQRHLLTMSNAWLLAGALSPIYTRPQKANSPNGSGVSLSNFNFLSKLICSVPSHWLLLYDSDEMGLGANRFLHHVLAYKGPTLVLFKAENDDVFCVAAPDEWKESHLYKGGEEAALFQLHPRFSLLEKGAKMLYLNLSVRGYPHGLRAGSDPRTPILTIDSGFEKMDYKKIPYDLLRIEVWGCGDPVSRETQLEIKKWEVKEAERQRSVKLSAADWLDHPDRYLLELAGRAQYHQNQTQPQ